MLDEPADLAVGQAVSVVVADEVPAEPPPPRRSLAGFAKGWFVMADDFNDIPEEFEEYL